MGSSDDTDDYPDSEGATSDRLVLGTHNRVDCAIYRCHVCDTRFGVVLSATEVQRVVDLSAIRRIEELFEELEQDDNRQPEVPVGTFLWKLLRLYRASSRTVEWDEAGLGARLRWALGQAWNRLTASCPIYRSRRVSRIRYAEVVISNGPADPSNVAKPGTTWVQGSQESSDGPIVVKRARRAKP